MNKILSKDACKLTLVRGKEDHELHNFNKRNYSNIILQCKQKCLSKLGYFSTHFCLNFSGNKL